MTVVQPQQQQPHSQQQQAVDVLLSVKGLCKTLQPQQQTQQPKQQQQNVVLWRGIDFQVHRGEVVFVRGPSGVGKTLLLRTLACLDPVEGGNMKLRGKSPSEVGIPCWRAQVMYVHQQRVTYPGTPLQFMERVQGFASQQSRGLQDRPGPLGDLGQVVEAMGLDRGVLGQQWSQLSGGQAQRVSLAISIALRPEVLLLDEPTSACDMDATLKVEAVLRQVAAHAAVVWVTHDDQQPARVGGKVFALPMGVMSDIGGEASSSSSSNNGGSSAAAALPSSQAAWRSDNNENNDAMV